jgi:signal peptidase II
MFAKRYIVPLLIICCCVGCDQATKEVARQTLQDTVPISWLYDTIRLHYTENPGAFLSLGAGLSYSTRFWIFLVLPGIVLCGIGAWSFHSTRFDQWERLAFALTIGGGFGNLIDRFLYAGHVSDFLNLGIGPLRTGIFNLADVMIMCGTGGIIICNLLRRPK